MPTALQRAVSKLCVCRLQDSTCAIKTTAFFSSNIPWNISVLVVTVYVLLIGEMHVLAIPPEYDNAFFAMDWVAFALFFTEWTVKAVTWKYYILTFESVLEFFAAVFVIPMFYFLNGSKTLAVVARLTMALRLLFRVVRLSTMSIKATQQMKKFRDSRSRGRPSLIEATLVRRTNMKLLLAILVLLVGCTFVDTEYWGAERSEELAFYTLVSLYPVYNGSALWDRTWHAYRDGIKQRNWQLHSRDYLWGDGRDEGDSIELIYLKIGGIEWWNNPPAAPLRDGIMREVLVLNCAESNGECDCSDCEAKVNIRALVRVEAVLSLALNILSIVVVLFWNLTFEHDYRRYILQPIKRMMGMLNKMADDPRTAFKIMKRTEEADKGSKRQSPYLVAALGKATEIKLVETVLVKLGNLLQMGFGEAGLHIISRNLKTGRFQPVAPGERVNAIFGFCDIRNFTDCCEQLNEKTMRFTNSIAEIVHEEVVRSGGSVNKNIGDAFLAVWKVRAVIEEVDDLGDAEADASTDGKPKLQRTRTKRRSLIHHLDGCRAHIVDEVLRAFLNMRVQVRDDREIQAVAQMPELQDKFPGFRIRMGYGLHLGTAIEGAIGSRFKVDASYLGPNVNVSMRLEELTKTYGCWLLMTHHFHQDLCPELKAWCRPIDIVELHTDEPEPEPVVLFTYDHVCAEAGDSAFMAQWCGTFRMYQSGQWSAARDGFGALISGRLDAGGHYYKGAKVLLDLMSQHDFRATENWAGHRVQVDLGSKATFSTS